MPAPSGATDLPSLDEREFVMISSTNSAVDPDAPSRFRYHERDGVIWGEYWGDTVTFGRFVGTRRAHVLAVTFAHVTVTGGSVVTGASTSTVEEGADGLRLVERFSIEGVDHESVCVEVVPGL
ncbi:hypothetical protein [Humibacter ginsenosidimutans]|nr:hypothetical protein [Humibacter ginsenosidimutans]